MNTKQMPITNQNPQEKQGMPTTNQRINNLVNEVSNSMPSVSAQRLKKLLDEKKLSEQQRSVLLSFASQLSFEQLNILAKNDLDVEKMQLYKTLLLAGKNDKVKEMIQNNLSIDNIKKVVETETLDEKIDKYNKETKEEMSTSMPTVSKDNGISI